MFIGIIKRAKVWQIYNGVKPFQSCRKEQMVYDDKTFAAST